MKILIFFRLKRFLLKKMENLFKSLMLIKRNMSGNSIVIIYSILSLVEHQGTLYSILSLVEHQGTLYSILSLVEHQGTLYSILSLVEHQGTVEISSSYPKFVLAGVTKY